jgi:2-methylfumaryl-CoA isomerase
MVVAITDRQWSALLRAVGMSESLPAAAQALGLKLATQGDRYAARDLISAALRPWFAARTLAEVAEALADRSILWGPYRSFTQMLAEDPRCSPANPMFAQVEHPGVGRFLTAASPLDFGDVPRLPPQMAPRLGEHTREVLGAVLGLDAAALDALAADGVIPGASR